MTRGGGGKGTGSQTHLSLDGKEGIDENKLSEEEKRGNLRKNWTISVEKGLPERDVKDFALILLDPSY